MFSLANAGSSNYDAANTPVKAIGPGLVTPGWRSFR